MECESVPVKSRHWAKWGCRWQHGQQSTSSAFLLLIFPHCTTIYIAVCFKIKIFINPDSVPGFCQSRFFTRFLSIQILYQVFINPDSLPGFYQSRFFTRVLSIQILDQVFINPDSWPLIVFWLALWFSSIPEGIGSFGEHEGWFSTGPLPLFSAYGGRRRRMSKKKKKGGGWGGGEEAY